MISFTHEEHIKLIDDFREMVSEKINRPELVMESKELVDQLCCELANTTRDFIVKNDILKTNTFLASAVAYRALHFTTSMSFGWTLDSISVSWINEWMRRNLKR